MTLTAIATLWTHWYGLLSGIIALSHYIVLHSSLPGASGYTGTLRVLPFLWTPPGVRFGRRWWMLPGSCHLCTFSIFRSPCLACTESLDYLPGMLKLVAWGPCFRVPRHAGWRVQFTKRAQFCRTLATPMAHLSFRPWASPPQARSGAFPWLPETTVTALLHNEL